MYYQNRFFNFQCIIAEPEYHELPVEVAIARPDTYTVVFGEQRNTEIIRDNLGFMYHKNKETQNKM